MPLEYLNKLSEKERLENVYTINKNSSNDQNSWSATGDHTKNGYRLPSEAEWEYASLAGQPASTYKDNEDYRWWILRYRKQKSQRLWGS